MELFFVGNCSTSQALIHSIETNTVYQFRVQLSPAHSCHCVTLTATNPAFNQFLDWCVQPITNISTKLCAMENISTYLSKPVAIQRFSIIGNLELALECSHPFVMQNTMDTAVAYEGMFSSCPESHMQCLFPLESLKTMSKANEM